MGSRLKRRVKPICESIVAVGNLILHFEVNSTARTCDLLVMCHVTSTRTLAPRLLIFIITVQMNFFPQKNPFNSKGKGKPIKLPPRGTKRRVEPIWQSIVSNLILRYEANSSARTHGLLLVMCHVTSTRTLAPRLLIFHHYSSKDFFLTQK